MCVERLYLLHLHLPTIVTSAGESGGAAVRALECEYLEMSTAHSLKQGLKHNVSLLYPAPSGTGSVRQVSVPASRFPRLGSRTSRFARLGSQGSRFPRLGSPASLSTVGVGEPLANRALRTEPLRTGSLPTGNASLY